MAKTARKRTKRRRYTDDERATALAALAANAGNVAKTSRQLKIPGKTLEQWAKGSRHPESAQMSEVKKGVLADHLEGVAWRLADGIRPEKINETPLDKVAVTLGIVVDKMRLLREQPTGITRSENAEDDLSDLTDEELARRLDSARSRAQTAGAGADSPGAAGSGSSPNGSRAP